MLSYIVSIQNQEIFHVGHSDTVMVSCHRAIESLF